MQVCDYPAIPATIPHITLSLLITFIPIFPSIQAVFEVFEILFERYFFTFVPIVVDCLLFLFFLVFLGYYLLSSWNNISIVFKIGSMALQRTIYDPILRAILIPECTYFHPQNLKIFHFWHKIVKLTYCIIFWSLQKIEFLK